MCIIWLDSLDSQSGARRTGPYGFFFWEGGKLSCETDWLVRLARKRLIELANWPLRKPTHYLLLFLVYTSSLGRIRSDRYASAQLACLQLLQIFEAELHVVGKWRATAHTPLDSPGSSSNRFGVTHPKGSPPPHPFLRYYYSSTHPLNVATNIYRWKNLKGGGDYSRLGEILNIWEDRRPSLTHTPTPFVILPHPLLVDDSRWQQGGGGQKSILFLFLFFLSRRYLHSRYSIPSSRYSTRRTGRQRIKRENTQKGENLIDYHLTFLFSLPPELIEK
jgi:hypothetical protein